MDNNMVSKIWVGMASTNIHLRMRAKFSRTHKQASALGGDNKSNNNKA